jgi:hypothetical protein
MAVVSENYIKDINIYQCDDDFRISGNALVLGTWCAKTITVEGNFYVTDVVKAKKVSLNEHVLGTPDFAGVDELIMWGTPAKWVVGMNICGRQITMTDTHIRVSCKTLPVAQWRNMTETRMKTLGEEEAVEWLKAHREAMDNIWKSIDSINSQEE